MTQNLDQFVSREEYDNLKNKRPNHLKSSK